VHAFVFVLAVITAPAYATTAQPAAAPAVPAFGPHVVYGIIRLVAPSSITVVRHNGQLMVIDISYAKSVGRTGPLYVGRAIGAFGTYDRAMHYHANAVESANGIHHGFWPDDV
jgi:hypothetical protein